MKDGPEGDTIYSHLNPVTVGIDEDGEPITSCVIVPAEPSAKPGTDGGPRLTPNQRTLFTILHDAGERGMSIEEWNERGREAGIGTTRKADLYDIRAALLVRQCGDRWNVC